MHDALKIAVIGGGSTYTPELIEGLLDSVLPIREVALVDPDLWKLEIVGRLAQRMAASAARPFPVTLTETRGPALDGADVVITQLRVGGMAARILDETIPQRYGVIGQETTGPGGFAKALRTIPVILDIAREMAERCPDAWLVNFTNPSGIITEALRLHGHSRYVGLCNFPLTLKMNAAKALEVAPEQVELAYFGLNHLSWARVLVAGEDRTATVLAQMLADPAWHTLSGYAFAPEVLQRLGMIPNGYLRYYYDAEAMVREQHAAKRTRGAVVHDIEEHLLACYADTRLCRKPLELQQRGGAWYSTAAVRLLDDLLGTGDGVHVLNVPNGQAIPFLPAEVIVEVPARVTHGRITNEPLLSMAGDTPLLAGHPVPPDVPELLRRVKTYELAVAHAAVTGSRADALAALAAHPLLDDRPEIAAPLLDDLLAAHQPYLPQYALANAG